MILLRAMPRDLTPCCRAVAREKAFVPLMPLMEVWICVPVSIKIKKWHPLPTRTAVPAGCIWISRSPVSPQHLKLCPVHSRCSKGGCWISDSFDPAVPLLSMCSEEIHMHRSVCTRMGGAHNWRGRVIHLIPWSTGWLWDRIRPQHWKHTPNRSGRSHHWTQSTKELGELTRWGIDNQLVHRSYPPVTDSYKHLRDFTPWDTKTPQGPSTLGHEPQIVHIPHTTDTDPKTTQTPCHLRFTLKIWTGLPWWRSGLRIHLPMQGTRVRSLVWEDPTCRGATKPPSHNYWAHMPQLLKPTCLEPVLHNNRSHRNKKPAHRNKE